MHKNFTGGTRKIGAKRCWKKKQRTPMEKNILVYQVRQEGGEAKKCRIVPETNGGVRGKIGIKPYRFIVRHHQKGRSEGRAASS